ncbi:hypothetical protein [Methylocucumis oryzae]|uniref:Uncharacterized protein n=1 Tax=Methylocucumis oryzae TaxID=1632867 RepID=A0A0F3IKE0_9GAMM|nr:hypothetical protein [Methylocucumis oryzae]KJV07132.1 hypothetical protein VZ94_06870 [Methylocucumis oryzae]
MSEHLLARFGWMLFDDINRRLSILIEECLHLQQVVQYEGGFKIDKSRADGNVAGFKKYCSEDI